MLDNFQKYNLYSSQWSNKTKTEKPNFTVIQQCEITAGALWAHLRALSTSVMIYHTHSLTLCHNDSHDSHQRCSQRHYSMSLTNSPAMDLILTNI